MPLVLIPFWQIGYQYYGIELEIRLDLIRFSWAENYYESRVDAISTGQVVSNKDRIVSFPNDEKGTLVIFDWGKSNKYTRWLVFDPSGELSTDKEPHRHLGYGVLLNGAFDTSYHVPVKAYHLKGNFYVAYIDRSQEEAFPHS